MTPALSLTARAVCLLLCAPLLVLAQDAAPSAAEVRALIDQNRRLQQQVEAQQRTIDALSASVADLKRADAKQEQALQSLREGSAGAASENVVARDRSHEIRLTGEAGLAFFNTGPAGMFPKAEFRADDPRLMVEAPVWKDVYLYGELDLLTRETNVDSFQLGEFYVEFEGISRLWGASPDVLTLRAGRVAVPFGEEYQLRSPINNPLISHSLSDIWGNDEGVVVFGRTGTVSYALAVQNGGTSRLHDFNADKAVVGRVGWEPAKWLHVSASAMRTGELATVADNLSEVWFANAFFRALGPAKSTAVFWANLYEADAVARWKGGRASLALGQVRFDDSDTTADNSRRIRYGSLEVTQDITEKLFGAARYSEIRAPGGYPLAGWGSAGTFFFRPSLTEELRRLSLGAGWRFGPPLIWKMEYTRESGRMLNGAPRDQEDFFGSEIAVRF